MERNRPIGVDMLFAAPCTKNRNILRVKILLRLNPEQNV